MGIEILIISDLHIGGKARGKDLQPNPIDPCKWWEETYVHDFFEFVNNETMSFDYLIVTGDISETASIEEISLGYNIIETMANKAC